ncbi:helix-turn-helix transcriptional regulator [Azorhizobium caulinodans]|uniref:helix-turn-helix domain-containing protein n=1 Tax=Azorhizobium caulinodans TaxID=7 RepID=UPI002FBE0B95
MPTDDQTPSGSRASDSTIGHEVRILSDNMVNGRLIAAARALIGWEQQELAEHAGIKRQTLADMEGDVRKPQARIRQAVLNVLQLHGVRFVEVGGADGLIRSKVSSDDNA